MKITKVEARPAAVRAKFIAFARTTTFFSGSLLSPAPSPADVTDTVSPEANLSMSTARNLVRSL
jgi:hypothetical protein